MKHIALCGLLALLVGCANQPYISPPQWNVVTVRVTWLSLEEVREVCQNPRVSGCATNANGEGGLSQIFAVKPESFSDEWRVLVLGHELLHALGATHQ